MKRLAIALSLALTASAVVRADVTINNTITFTGGMSAMMSSGGPPTMLMRIKGNKARMDMEMMGQKMTTLMDNDTKQMTMLQHAQKTAQVMDMATMLTKMPNAGQMPQMDAKVEPTGNTREINGQNCSEYKYSMTIDMANMAANMGAAPGGHQMPAGAAEMFKDLKMVMNGTMWVAKDGPGVDEYVKFSKAAQGGMMAFSGFGGGMPGAPGMEGLMKAFSQLEGMAMLTEVETSFEGASPMIEMMKSMGNMKISTKVTEVSTAALADDLFAVPADYTVTKQ